MDIGPLGKTPSLEVLRDVFERCLNDRDADALTAYWDEDIVEEFPVGTFHGRAAVRDHFAETFAAIPDFHIEVRTMAAEGETVFVRWHMTGTFDGAPWMGIEPTGARLVLDGIDCFTIRNGYVVHNFVMFDQLSFARQIGMLPSQDSLTDRLMTSSFNMRTKLRRRLGLQRN